VEFLLVLLVFGTEALFGALRESLEIAHALLAPKLLLAATVRGQLFAEPRGPTKKPQDQLVRKIFKPFHKFTKLARDGSLR
jgi:hypothetical protein